ncbi:MAG: DUF3095 domain-containing protein [Bdellovibrionota bacterium]
MASKEQVNLGFYKNLEPIHDYKRICDASLYREVPQGWVLFVCDVRSSTKAIKDGKYKEVNFVGAACITAVTNALKAKLQVPYVFGGDGATFLIYKEFSERVAFALQSVQSLAQNSYGLELRVACLNVAELQSEGFAFKVAKYALSQDLSIALFVGDGFYEAESRIKSEKYPEYLLSPSVESCLEHGDILQGLECRWDAIPSSNGEILTVLIRAQSKNLEENAQIYQELIEEISIICGDKNQVSPAIESKLKLNTRLSGLNVEVAIHTEGKPFLQRFRYWSKLLCEIFAGFLLMALKIKRGSVDWGLYKKKVVEHSDYWKFDDSLRFVFDLSGAQKRALLACLESKRRDAKLVYGVHSSSSALMTCLIFNRDAQHVHFVDGADGGYALAAIQLKAQMKKNELKDF